MRSLSLVLAGVLVLSAAACGSRSNLVEGDTPAPGDPPADVLPVELYVPDGAGCVASLDVQTAPEVMAPGSDQSIAVVDIVFATECTGAGGDYVLARQIGSDRAFWLGAHACEFSDAVFGPGIVYGVVLYRQTAALFQLSPDICVGFPDQPPGAQSDAKTDAIALFETLPQAEAFAATLDQGSP